MHPRHEVKFKLWTRVHHKKNAGALARLSTPSLFHRVAGEVEGWGVRWASERRVLALMCGRLAWIADGFRLRKKIRLLYFCEQRSSVSGLCRVRLVPFLIDN